MEKLNVVTPCQIKNCSEKVIFYFISETILSVSDMNSNSMVL